MWDGNDGGVLFFLLWQMMAASLILDHGAEIWSLLWHVVDDYSLLWRMMEDSSLDDWCYEVVEDVTEQT